MTPFSRKWGFDRGTPIDRVYIERFLESHANDVSGSCLEVLNAAYTDRFGGARVSRADVLDIDPANIHATIVADLGEPESLPAHRFDCIIFTQTLHLIPDMHAALVNVWQALRPGGVLLVTVPAMGATTRHQDFTTTGGGSLRQGSTACCRRCRRRSGKPSPSAMFCRAPRFPTASPQKSCSLTN